MAVFLKIITWIGGIIMGLVLAIGVFDLFGTGFVTQIMPTGIDDLAWANITLKEVTSAPSGILLKSEEYPTSFVITLIPPPANISELIKPGDKIAVRIKKESVEHLQDVKIAPTYGLQLKNGQQVFDNTKMITPMSDSNKNTIQKLFYKMIAIPILYFLLIIFCPIVWRKLKRQSRS